MAFDGIVTKCVALELSQKLVNGKIEKAYQPEADEIRLSIRSQGENFRLLLSASANNPRVHFTETTKENPMKAPVFCMLLRKHICGGRILSIEAFDFERVIHINVENITELGDTVTVTLIAEIMGKHSNLILVNQNNMIIDAIKHVDGQISRVREVMPARHYLPPPAQDKILPVDVDADRLFSFDKEVLSDAAKAVSELRADKYLLQKIKGFSPMLCKEICLAAGIEPVRTVGSFVGDEIQRLKRALEHVLSAIRENRYTPCLLWNGEQMQTPVDFYCLKIEHIGIRKEYDTISKVMDEYYLRRDRNERQAQKKAQLEKTLHNCLERAEKKLAIRQAAIRDVENRDELKLSGELITANIYQIRPNTDAITVVNYYAPDGASVTIPLNPKISPADNAQKFFKKYAKAKATFEQTTKQIAENIAELQYLESVEQSLKTAETEQEITMVRQELLEEGYLNGKRALSHLRGAKKSKGGKPGKYGNAAKSVKTAPQLLCFRSSEGFDIFAGRNNKENDQLTLKISSNSDLWLHTKDIPGSHVIIRARGGDIPDNTIREAAMIAAFYSKAGNSSSVPVDYTQVKHVKKPTGAKPGMVIYRNNRTIFVTPEEHRVLQLKINPDEKK